MNIVIEGGIITTMCDGKITLRAGKKSFPGPSNESLVDSFGLERLIP